MRIKTGGLICPAIYPRKAVLHPPYGNSPGSRTSGCGSILQREESTMGRILSSGRATRPDLAISPICGIGWNFSAPRRPPVRECAGAAPEFAEPDRARPLRRPGTLLSFGPGLPHVAIFDIFSPRCSNGGGSLSTAGGQDLMRREAEKGRCQLVTPDGAHATAPRRMGIRAAGCAHGASGKPCPRRLGAAVGIVRMPGEPGRRAPCDLLRRPRP